MSMWSILDTVRNNPERLRWSQRLRGLNPSVVDKAVRLDAKWRKARAKVSELQRQRNEVSRHIAKTKDQKEKQRLIQETKLLSEKVSKEEQRVEKIDKQRMAILQSIPNIAHESVPEGRDETENQPVKYIGKPLVWRDYLDPFLAAAKGLSPKYTVVEEQPLGHYDISEQTGMIDTERAAKTTGARYYFLMQDIVFLDLALALYALDSISQLGFTPIMPPHLLNHAAYSGVTDIGAFEDALYKLEERDLYLIATSEHPIAARFMKEVLEIEELPLLLAGYSPCYRKEAGAHGKDTKGIFRVHQFSKVEQFVFCHPDDSWEWIEKMIKYVEDIWRPLGLPFRIVNMCGGDLGRVAAKTYDMEVWMPSQGQYREMVSCSNCTDYQSARLDTRFAEKRGHPTKGFVHTLNSTVIATTRAITAVLENNLQPDGRILIPKPLLKYLKPIEAAPGKYITPLQRRE
jgi:seryl-tRNA synthetase